MPSPSLLLRSSRTLPPVASPPRRATHGSRHRPHALSQPVRALKNAAASPPPNEQHSQPQPQPQPQPRQPAAAPAAASRNNIVPIPASIRDVDNGRILGFGADLAPDHPGFHDRDYKLRRASLAELAKTHVPGTPPPLVAYSDAETALWAEVHAAASRLYPLAACPEFLRALPALGFAPHAIPQLRDVSATLERATGWAVRPVAGLMHPRDFLAGLAFRTFHSTQYTRHGSRPAYTPEPDVCHELLGHVPMLTNPLFAEMVRAIGVASLGADEARLWHLTKVYWFVVEFGVISSAAPSPSLSSSSSSAPSPSLSSSSSSSSAPSPSLSSSSIPKAFGAGILSSFGEMEHLLSGRGYSVAPFDPFAPQPRMSYKDGVQKRYMSLESFEAGRELLLEYCAATTPVDVRRRFGLL